MDGVGSRRRISFLALFGSTACVTTVAVLFGGEGVVSRGRRGGGTGGSWVYDRFSVMLRSRSDLLCFGYIYKQFDKHFLSKFQNSSRQLCIILLNR